MSGSSGEVASSKLDDVFLLDSRGVYIVGRTEELLTIPVELSCETLPRLLNS